MKKRVKIVATMGPSSDSRETIEKMILAGVDVFRFNFSHGEYSYHLKNLESVREISKKLNRYTTILQDICGPKIRVGEIDGEFELKAGDILEFHREKLLGVCEDGIYKISTNQPEVLKNLKISEYIYLADGRVEVEVIDIDDRKITTKVLFDGTLSSKKGINFPNTKMGVSILTPKDIEDIKWGIENQVDYIGLSFVQSSDDVKMAKELIKSFGGVQKVFSKIEKFDAIEDIDNIIDVSDGIMVARGDLGIEVPYYRVPVIQKNIIKKANQKAKPVITATQMLFSTTKNRSATRAEISDVANAVLDGSDAVMLSEESAVGVDPVNSVNIMVNTILEVENIYPFYNHHENRYKTEAESVANSIVELAHGLNASAILSFTTSGNSTRILSKFRPENQIAVAVSDERIARELNIVWGVIPICMIESDDLEEVIVEFSNSAREYGLIEKDRDYVISIGNRKNRKTNTIKILKG